jgi:hypothetical protein
VVLDPGRLGDLLGGSSSGGTIAARFLSRHKIPQIKSLVLSYFKRICADVVRS